MSIRRDQVINHIIENEVKFSIPFGVCIGKDGIIYFTDYNKHIVCKVIDGKSILHAGISYERGIEDGAFGTLYSPVGIVEGEEGHLYVVCRDSGSLRKVFKNGSLSTICTGLKQPYGITKDCSGNLYVTEYDGDCVLRVNMDGVLTPFVNHGEIRNPTALTFDIFGNLLVSEYITGKIKRISPDGRFPLSLMDQDNSPFYLARPISMTVDVTGIYVTEKMRNTIIKIEMPIEWSTSLHSEFPVKMKTQIKTWVMLTMKKGHVSSQIWRLPKDIWLIVVGFIVSQ